MYYICYIDVMQYLFKWKTVNIVQTQNTMAQTIIIIIFFFNAETWQSYLPIINYLVIIIIVLCCA